jgi:hypothetical protein
MIRNLALLAMAAAALAACNSDSHTIVANDAPDPMAEQLANAAPVELPPAIAATKIYRCKDNGLIRIDWLAGGQGANLRVGDATTAIALRAPAPAPTADGANVAAPAEGVLTADGGYSLKGDASASTVTLASPGKGAQNCHV